MPIILLLLPDPHQSIDPIPSPNPRRAPTSPTLRAKSLGVGARPPPLPPLALLLSHLPPPAAPPPPPPPPPSSAEDGAEAEASAMTLTAAWRLCSSLMRFFRAL